MHYTFVSTVAIYNYYFTMCMYIKNYFTVVFDWLKLLVQRYLDGILNIFLLSSDAFDKLVTLD